MGISKKIFLLAALFFGIGLVSCKDWGEMDPPAGNQQKPNLTTLATYTFDGFDANVQAGAYEGGKSPKLVTDPQLEVVLELDGGYLQYSNPVQHVSLQEGMGVTGWVKLNKEDNEGAIFSFSDGTDKLVFTGDCSLYFKNKKLTTISQTLTAGEWHWLAVQVMNDGIIINIDGVPVGTTPEPAPEEVRSDNASEEDKSVSLEVLDFLTTNASSLYFGYGSESVPTKRWVKQFTVYKNTITEAEITKPELPEIGGGEEVTVLPDPVYFNNFEGDNADCTINGDGRFENAGDIWGNVFQNGGGAQRTHYLLLPENALSHSGETKEMSIVFWINAKNAGASNSYMWSPMFMAYGAAPSNNTNTSPMFACQYRGVVTINTNPPTNVGTTWTDLVDAQNVNGVNTVYHDSNDWLADDDWHLYTATLTEKSIKVYFDGELKNEWKISGDQSIGGENTGTLLTGESGLTYICLGGNQAWNWGDNDAAFMFDDIAIYNKVLNEKQMAKIISSKKATVPTE